MQMYTMQASNKRRRINLASGVLPLLDLAKDSCNHGWPGNHSFQSFLGQCVCAVCQMLAVCAAQGTCYPLDQIILLMVFENEVCAV